MIDSEPRVANRWLPLALLALLAWPTLASAAGPGGPFPAWTPMPGVQPEGVAVDKAGTLYVTVRQGDDGIVLKYAPDGAQAPVARVGPGLVGGLAVTSDGDLYVAVALGAGRGVYRIPRGGQPELVPGTDRIVFANALAFDQRGTLYISESYSLAESGAYAPGGVWRVSPRGTAEVWIRHPLLTGLGYVLGYPVGANGIACFHGSLFVVNTDKGVIVQIPVMEDGAPGQPDVWAPVQEVPGSPLAGLPIPPMGDGLVFDVHGNAYVALVSRGAIVRLDARDRSQHVVAFFQFGPAELPLAAPLDTPASLAFGTGSGEQQALFVTNLGMMQQMAPGPPWPGPGLVKIDTGAPGRPLR